ncbi:MAG TPA: MipA/OmpV family protein [Novosphingobium sp.]
MMRTLYNAPAGAAITLGLGVFFALSRPAMARERAPDRIAVAVGVTVAPDYEGSDDYNPTLATGALVRVDGWSVTWKGNSLSVDLIPEYRDQTFKIVAGPIIDFNFDRAITPHDPVVGLTRRRKVALEGGGFVGFAKTGVLTSAYDTVSVTLTGGYDLGNVHHSLIVTPSLTYSSPLSRGTMVQLGLSADVVGGRYARYYFGVGGNSATTSGLPRYQPGGGLKSVSIGLGGAVALNGDLDRRGFLVGGYFNFERLLGSFAASPVVATRGNANQLSVSAGVGYHF